MKKYFTHIRLLLILVLVVFTTNWGWGQINITAGTTITENFDGIGTTATATLPTNWKVDKNTTVRTLGTYAAAGTATERNGGNSMSTTATAGIYNFGAGDAATATDRAVGGLSSSSASKSVNIYTCLKNNGISDITNLEISFDVEKYRGGSNAAGFTIQMYYSTDGSTWTSAGDNFKVSFTADADNSGYASAPGATTSITNKNLNVSIPASGNLYLAWNYSVSSGTTTSNAQALGIDNVAIIAHGDTQAPIASFNPTTAATGIEPNTNIVLTFDEAILKTDGSEVTDGDLSSLVVLKKTNESGNSVAFSATINGAKTEITVDPTSNLSYDQPYYVAIGAVEDATGNESATQSSTFTTRAASTTATVTSTEYTVNNTTETITDIPFGTTLDTFKGNITPATAATFNVYTDLAGITEATDLQTGYYLICTAEDNTTKKTYTITVNALLSTETEITAFSFVQQTGPATINTTNHTVSIEVAYGTDRAHLTPTIEVSARATIDPASNVEQDFSNSFDYTVTAEDGTTTQVWTVTVTVAPNNKAEIITFSFAEQTGPATITSGTATIDIEVDYGTDVSNLVATFTLSAEATATVDEVVQESGTTPNDFSSPVTYKVIAENGTIKNWTVTVTVLEPSHDATVTSTYYNVSGLDITGIPYQEKLDFFRSKIKPATDASFEVYEDDGLTVATDLQTGYLLICTAQDGTTKNTYTITKGTEPAIDLFISEYIEGNSNNKAIEIYNPLRKSVDLSSYTVKLGSNGGAWGTTATLSGTLAAGDVYVLYNSSAGAAITSVGDLSSGVCAFNGDDAIGLFKNGELIDVVGKQGEDPGSAWNVAGTTNATVDHTLVRKPEVHYGNTTWYSSAGTTVDNSEWIVYVQDETSYLGAHTTTDIYTPAATFAPADAATDVALNTIPTITFDEAIRNTDGSEVTDANVDALITFTVKDGPAVAFDATISGDKKVITVTPSADLDHDKTYTLSLAPVEDAAGNESATQSVTFATVTWPQYQVVFAVTGANGTLTAKADGEDINSGDFVFDQSDIVFTATPNAGYKVKEWTLNTAVVPGNTTTSYTITDIAENSTVTVEFTPILVTSVAVNSAGNATEVVYGQTLQMSVEVLPNDALDKTVTWSVTNDTGAATISTDGLLTATGAGTVTVKATANDGSAVYGEKPITVTKATATVNLTNLSQTYTSTARSASATTVPEGLTVTFTYDGSATEPINAGTYAVIGTISNPNYEGSASNNLVIGKAALTIKANNFTKVQGADHTFAGTEFETTGLLGSDGVTSVTLTSDGAAAAAAVGEYDIVPSAALGTGLDNYNITYTNGTLTVTNKTVVNITGITADSKVYDGNTTATISNWGTLVGVSGDDDVSIDHSGASASFATKTVASNKAVTVLGLALAGSDANKYIIGAQNSVTANITAKELTVTGASAISKVYNGTNSATISGATLEGMVTGDDVELDALTGTFASSNVAENIAVTATLTLKGVDKNNYSLTQPAGLTANITAAPLTVTADAKTKVYGDDDPALTYQVTGTLYGTDALSGALSRVAGENVNTYAIQQNTVTAGGNYAITYVPANLTITARPITITADAKTKVYGDADPAFTYQITSGSLVSGDEITGALSRTAGEAIGNYAINQNTLTAGSNYAITYASANLSITKKELTIGGTFTANSKDYDGTTAATINQNNLTLVGVVTDDVVTLTDVVVVFASSAVGNGIEVSIASANITGDDASNYTLSLTGAPTATADILATEYTATFTVTDGVNPIVGATVTVTGQAALPITDANGQTSIVLSNGSYDYEVSANGYLNATGSVVVDYADENVDVTLTLNPIQTILGWETNAIPDPKQVSLATSTNNSHLESSLLSRGAGIGTDGTAAANTFFATGWEASSVETAQSTNEYFQITAQAKAGYKVSLNSISFNFRRSSTGPNAFQWFYSLDGTNFTAIGTSISYTGTDSNGKTFGPIDISSITDLQEVSGSNTIYLRLYGWGATATSGSGSIGRLTGEDIIIKGSVEVEDDVIAPVVTFAPTNGSTDIAVNVNPTISFSEPVVDGSGNAITDASTVANLKSSSNVTVPSNITINEAKTLITIVPNTALNYGETYTINLADVRDAAGNTLTASSSNFTTVSYNVTFNVTDGTNSIEGASVTLNGVGTQTTNSSGQTVFANVTPNTYSYSISKAGFVTGTGSVTLLNASITENKTLSVQTFTITASAGEHGSIDPSGAVSVNYGTNRAFAATANTGYHILALTVDGSGVTEAAGETTYTYTFNNVVDNHTIAATFELTTYTVTFNVTDNGTNAPIEGATVTLTGYTDQTTNASGVATFTNVAPGANIAYSVSKDGYVTKILSLTVDGNKTENVKLSEASAPTYTVTFTVKEGETLLQGATVELAGNGQQTTDISGIATFTGVGIANNIAYTVSKTGYNSSTGTVSVVDKDESVNVSLVIKTFTIASTAGENGTIDPLGEQTVNYGANKTFTVTASANYHIASLLVDGTTSIPDAVGQSTYEYTFNNVTAAHTIAAKFAINTYTITASATENGTINPEGSVVVNHGADQVFAINAAEHYHIASLLADGEPLAGVEGQKSFNHTFWGVTANHTIAVTFAIDTYTIAVTAGEHGTTTPNTNQTVNYGDHLTFTIEASSGYHISDVLVDGASVGAISTYTFSNVDANHTFETQFAEDVYYTIATSVNPEGAGKTTGGDSYLEGSSVTVAATANNGYTFTNWTENSTIVSTDASYTFTATANRTLVANFAEVVIPVAVLPITTFSGPWASIAETGWSQMGLSSDYSGAKAKFDSNGDWVMVHFDSEPETLTCFLKGNTSGDPWDGTFAIEESANGTDWTAVHTFTGSGNIPTTAYTKYSYPLSPNSRWVRWIYQTKVIGNVGLDDVSITKLSTSTPSLAISSPAPSQTVNSRNVDVVFTTANFVLNTDGHVKYAVDGGEAQYTDASPISLTGLSVGNHSITLELVDMTNTSLDPAVVRTVNFVVQLGVDATLSDIKVGGTTIENFSKTVLTYNVELPFGTTHIPEVTYTLSDTKAQASKTDAAQLPGTTTIVVTAEDGTTQLTYSINFTVALPSTNATLIAFTLGGENVLALPNIVVTNPATDPGAIKYKADYNGFEGIVAIPAVGATRVVTLNGNEISEGNLAAQTLAAGDVIVVTVTAQDGIAKGYYKVTLSNENRTLAIIKPEGGETYQAGSEIVVNWTSTNIANVNIYAYSVTLQVEHLVGSAEAQGGTYTFGIPNGIFGSYTIRVKDASDETFSAESNQVTVVDAIAPSVVWLLPEDEAADVPVVPPSLRMNFDELITKGTGNIYLKSNGTTVETINIDACEINEKQVMIPLSATLNYSTAYYVEMEAAVVTDLSGNPFGAITGSDFWSFTTINNPAGLFFSEYIEGSSSNKAIEIYNPTGNTIDLSLYAIKQSNNGAGWGMASGTTVEDTRYILPLTGTLAPGKVYVIANASANASILAEADMTLAYSGTANGCAGCNVLAFNGDDALGLFKNMELIDVIGVPSEKPASGGWMVAGVNSATLDHTMVRKNHVTKGNIDWASAQGTNADNSEWVVTDKDIVSFLGWHIEKTVSSEKDIISFTLPEQTGPAVINTTDHTVSVEVLYGTSLTSLTPTIVVSGKASISPASGVAQDFSSTVEYTVTAEDGSQQVWTVTVTVASSQSSEKAITGFTIANQISSTINAEAKTVTVVMPYGAALDALSPTVTVSTGATVSPLSGATVDFSQGAVEYTVTAQDGTTAVWTVTVTNQVPVELTIHDIQYTENANGNSPHNGALIRTKGIVTAIQATKQFFIQDGQGAWNGIYVYSNAHTVAVGDEVEVIATVQEYSSLTELTSVKSVTVLSSENPLPTPANVTVVEALAEGYESVLIKFTHVECTAFASRLWTLTEGASSIVADYLLFAYTPETGRFYDVTGIGYFSYNARKILPRNAEDVKAWYNMPVSIAEGQGSTSPSVGDHGYLEGTYVWVEATPAEHYHFVKWMIGNVEVTENPHRVTLTSDTTASAYFALNEYTIAVDVDPVNSGTVTGAGVYTHGATVTLTATPNTGFAFAGWVNESNILSEQATLTFTAERNMTLTAKFVEEGTVNYIIAVAANPVEGGTVSGGGIYKKDESVTISAIPAEHYHFVKWTEDGADFSAVASVTFLATADSSLVAQFELDKHTITATVNPAGSGTITGAGEYAYGSQATLTAEPNTTYEFVGWIENGSVIETSTTLSFIVTGDRSIEARFKTAGTTTWTITTTVNPANSGSATGGGVYDDGSEVTLNATPGNGYHFVNWTENSAEVSANATYTFTASANRNLVANFAINTYQIAVSANPTAGGSVTGANTYNHGVTVTVTATANAGYEFISWTEGETTVSTDATYIFTATADRNLVANFSEITYTITFNVTYNSAAIAGATIAIDGVSGTLTTDANGTATVNLANGTYNYTVSATNYSNYTGSLTVASATQTVSVVMVPVGINEPSLTAIRTYPNPFSNEIRFEGVDNLSQITITNIIGERILDTRINNQINRIDTQWLPRGIYMVRFVNTKGEKVVRKMVKE